MKRFILCTMVGMAPVLTLAEEEQPTYEECFQFINDEMQAEMDAVAQQQKDIESAGVTLPAETNDSPDLNPENFRVEVTPGSDSPTITFDADIDSLVNKNAAPASEDDASLKDQCQRLYGLSY